MVGYIGPKAIQYNVDNSVVEGDSSIGGDLYLSGSAYTPVVQGLGDKAGLTFGGDIIAPRKNNAPADGTVDLGAADASFKDLYLSGGVYLGGTDAVNKLDDYEEGTFDLHFLDAPGFSNAVSDVYNKYVKINNRVTVKGYFGLSGASSSTSIIRINGLPFNSATDDLAVGVYLNGKGTASGATFCVFNTPSSNDFYIYFNGATTDNNAVPVSYNNVGAIKGHFELSYFTD